MRCRTTEGGSVSTTLANGSERFLPTPAHPECERSERIEGAVSLDP